MFTKDELQTIAITFLLKAATAQDMGTKQAIYAKQNLAEGDTRAAERNEQSVLTYTAQRERFAEIAFKAEKIALGLEEVQS